MSGIKESLGFSPYDPGFLADPYPTYRAMRDAGRILWMPSFGGPLRKELPDDTESPGVFFLTHHADCMDLLRNEHLSSDPMKSDLFKVVMEMQLGTEGPAIDLMRNLLLFMDPPDHTRMRALANAAFSRRAVESLRPRIEQIVDELIDQALDAGEIELMTHLAYPLPVTVIAEMLGVPMADRESFETWSRDLIDLFGTETMGDESMQRGNAAIESFRSYFTDLLEDRKHEPRDDLLTAFAEVEEEGERLTLDELLATCMLLLIAGHETTANLIGLGVLRLLRTPEALEAMRDPANVSSGVEELLRFDGPIHATARTTLDEIEIAGVKIGPRQRVGVFVAAANRDPAVFDDPDTLRVDRSPNHHLAFGGGIHFCLGAPLARLETRIVFAKLLQRDLGLVNENIEYRTTYPIRGPRSVHVSVT